MTRIPRKIDLGIYTVRVCLVNKTQMRELDDDYEVGEPTAEGLWDVDTDSVYIGRWLTAQRKREVLFHELTHAMIDYREQGSHETMD